MPGGDRTGPRGMGSRSGRGAGLCAGSALPGYASSGPTRGLGMGFGRGCGFGNGGRGRRHRFYAVGLQEETSSSMGANSHKKPSQEMEKEALRNQADVLQRELDAVRKQLNGL